MKNRVRNLTFALLLITLMLSITPIALAKTRQSHLVEFIYENQKGNESFGLTPQDTANAIEILDQNNAYRVEVLFEEIRSVDIPDLKVYLEDKIQAIFDAGEIDIYKIYYLLETLNRLESLETSLDSKLRDQIYAYISATVQIGGGFSPSNTSDAANMVSTYYIYNIFTIMHETVENETIHKAWVLSCNNTDGGYGGNQSLSSTLTTTYFAVNLVSELGSINDLANQTNTLNYFKSLYIGDSSNLEQYGGYLPGLYAETPLLSSTYLCVEGIKLIDENKLNRIPTSNWVLKHQNFLDGGFGDWNEGSDQKISSISTSYSAFKILQILGSLDLLREDIFMVEPSFLTLIIVLSVIGVIALVVFFLWRRRRI
ncbi:MAG: terpene cyclase/mutase family protein [Candidatus Lokiarchaeota archaeon]|nr:terpene cyclase/mutase family protein [Candidatus Lokiarchaeota archaeon]